MNAQLVATTANRLVWIQMGPSLVAASQDMC